MTGEQLKERLIRSGYQLKDVAELLEMSQQNFSKGLKVADVKTGLVEKICQVLNKKIDFFYVDTEFAPVVNSLTGASEELMLLKGQVMAYQDALDRIGRGESVL